MAYKYRPKGCKTWWIKYYKDRECVRKSLGTKLPKIAENKKLLIETQLAKSEDPFPRENTTYYQAFEAFKASRIGRIGKKTARDDHKRIQDFLEKVKTLKVTENALKAHLDGRISNDQISHRTANHTIRAIKTFFNFCVRSGYISKNPIQHMKKYPIPEQEPRFLTEEEARILLEKAKGNRIYRLVAAALYTGMRAGELDRLAWEDVDYDGNMIRVRLSKSGKFRLIPLHPALKNILGPKGQGKCLNTRYARALWENLRESLGWHDLRFHDLRHTFCSLLVKSGVDIVTVSKLAGHSSVSVTQIYAHLYPDHLKDSVQKLTI